MPHLLQYLYIRKNHNKSERQKTRFPEPHQSHRHPAVQHTLCQHTQPDNLPRQLFCKIPGASARNHSADLPGSLYVFPSAVRGDSPPSRSGLPPAVERMKQTEHNLQDFFPQKSRPDIHRSRMPLSGKYKMRFPLAGPNISVRSEVPGTQPQQKSARFFCVCLFR